MKLVDILARELKVWPESWGIYCVSSEVQGSFPAWFGYRNPVFELGGWSDIGTVELWLSEEPEDRRSVVVRRFEWQAAVDALKVEKTPSAKTHVALEEARVIRGDQVVCSAENVSVNANYFTHTSSPVNPECKIVQLEWNGEGLPPVGTHVVVTDDGSLMYGQGESGEVLAHVDGTAVIRMSYGLGCFLPRCLRTPEQIAAEKREKAIDAMAAVTGHPMAPLMRDSFFGPLYDAGYRKFEIVDN